jgi:hypothetical protein
LHHLDRRVLETKEDTMTLGRTLVRAIAAFANLHPVAREALTGWFEPEDADSDGEADR